MSNELKGVVIILAAYLVGEFISRLLGSLFPGSVLGMLLLFVLLQMGVVKEESIKGICNFILNNMMMLFVPVTVGIMISYRLIIDNWVAVIVTLIISTFLVLLIVGALQQFIGKRWRR